MVWRWTLNLIVIGLLALVTIVVCGAFGSTISRGGAVTVVAYGLICWLLGVLSPFGDVFGLSG